MIKKLDCDRGIGDGVKCVLNHFSPNDIAASPSTLLDTLIMYMYLVHHVDWYSTAWMQNDDFTVREESGTRVTGGELDSFPDLDHEDFVQDCLRDLRRRTKHFLQVN